MSDDAIVYDPYLEEFIYDHVAYDSYTDAWLVREEDRAVAAQVEQELKETA
jgi:hypothetical protein